ncbi:MAG: hypothetical protein E7450_05270 [Ruminococcaceae bacterium]|nr:hypothetical protein [Oscillospiraceae bacterium]
MSTKGTATAYKNICMVTAIVRIVIGMVALFFACFIASEVKNGTGALVILFPVGVYSLVDGVIKLVKSYVSGQTYLEVYEDRFVGTGMQGMKALSFNIAFSGVHNVCVERKFWLHICASGGTYKVMTNEKTAAEVCEYFTRIKG